MAKEVQGYFITGTDTGVGKTVVSTALISHLVERGYKVAGLKPIASGFEQHNGQLQNEDVQAVMAQSNVNLPRKRVNRYGFEPAIAPHIAAAESSQNIHFSKIQTDVDEAARVSDLVIVEGVGGWLVPLHGFDQKYQDIQGLALTLQLPVILVVGMRLGCLNHALMTAAMIAASGVPFAGWVANSVESEFPYFAENLATLEQQMPVPKLFDLAHTPISEAVGNLLHVHENLPS